MADDAGALASYESVVADLRDRGAQTGKMFGMPCLKTDAGKAFGGYFHGDMVFKLKEPDRARALSLPGAHLFDPSEQGRPMKEWVQVPSGSPGDWLELGRAALHSITQR
jgi:hypothetical protein